MVCKEDVISWFKDVESYERIDLMYALLNMCIPFELRFLGTCVEEIGKQSFQELRGASITANDLERLTKELTPCKDLLDVVTRHRVTVYVSLLQSKSFLCANWMYNYIMKSDWLDSFIANGHSRSDKKLHSELLLLFTLALNHPAFGIDQKLYCGHIITQLLVQNDFKAIKCIVTTHPYPPGLGHNKSSILQAHHIPARGISQTTVTHGEPSMPPPPGFSQPSPIDFGILPKMTWQRSYANYPQEMSPYPPPPISPLVSQHTSPIQSRPPSPRNANVNMTLRQQLQQQINQQFVLPELTLQSQQMVASNNYSIDLKNTSDELNHIEDDKLREPTQWLVPNIKLIQNGMLPPQAFSNVNNKESYPEQQLQALHLESESSLHSSSASSASSHSSTPPETPTQTHCPGRGCGANGVDPAILSQSFVPSVFQTPNRSILQYSSPGSTYHHRGPSQFYPPPHPHPHQINGGEVMYSAPVSYMPILYSSSVPPPSLTPLPHHQPPLNCYNCGAIGHMGDTCREQTIEDITQRKGYQLDYIDPVDVLLEQASTTMSCPVSGDN